MHDGSANSIAAAAYSVLSHNGMQHGTLIRSFVEKISACVSLTGYVPKDPRFLYRMLRHPAHQSPTFFVAHRYSHFIVALLTTSANTFITSSQIIQHLHQSIAFIHRSNRPFNSHSKRRSLACLLGRIEKICCLHQLGALPVRRSVESTGG